MYTFFEALALRNKPLFIFGCGNLLVALLSLVLSKSLPVTVASVNAWLKPLKFGLSIGIFSWTMGWLTDELHLQETVRWYSRSVIILLGFELLYICIQAARGQLSHYNRSTPLYAALYGLMGLAATVATLHTAYIGVLFCTRSFPQLPSHYIWSIRLGIGLFVIFAFEGAAMGGRSAHTVGGPDGIGPGMALLHWSRQYGDLRIAHFLGMHALQVLPLLSWYVLKNTRLTLLAGLIYSLLAIMILVQALGGKPLFPQPAQQAYTGRQPLNTHK